MYSSRDEMEAAITEVLAAVQEKHPDERAEGFVKIVLYSDGHGAIYEGPIDEDNILFEFSGKEELADWLDSGPIPEPTYRE